ncbi:MAG TPA: helix-turn-helix domain-containing protein [Novosphingobium sp.]|nr:helix-turn-helix domain-containing protein [Novosphingobium sp.]
MQVRRPDERRSRSQSASRTLDVLEYFGQVRRPLRAIEIVNMLSMNPSSTNQLLKTMVDSAHLLFDARTKTYMPSPRLAAFGTWIRDLYGDSDKFDELVCDIQARTGLFVTVSTQNDLFMQVIETRSPSGRTAQRGVRVAMFDSAVGLAYLSTLGAAEFDRLVYRGRITDARLPEITAEVEGIRQAGYASRPSTDASTWSIAMPIRHGSAQIPTVLGLSGAPEKVRDEAEEIFAIMRDAAVRHLGEESLPLGMRGTLRSK